MVDLRSSRLRVYFYEYKAVTQFLSLNYSSYRFVGSSSNGEGNERVSRTGPLIIEEWLESCWRGARKVNNRQKYDGALTLKSFSL